MAFTSPLDSAISVGVVKCHMLTQVATTATVNEGVERLVGLFNGATSSYSVCLRFYGPKVTLYGPIAIMLLMAGAPPIHMCVLHS